MVVIPHIYGAFLGPFILVIQSISTSPLPSGNSTVQIRMYSGNPNCGSGSQANQPDAKRSSNSNNNCDMFADAPAWFRNCCAGTFCCSDGSQSNQDNGNSRRQLSEQLPAGKTFQPNTQSKHQEINTPLESSEEKKKHVRVVVGKTGAKAIEYSNMYSPGSEEDNESPSYLIDSPMNYNRAKRSAAQHRKKKSSKHLLKSKLKKPPPSPVCTNTCDPSDCFNFNPPYIWPPHPMPPNPHPMIPDPNPMLPDPHPALPCPCDCESSYAEFEGDLDADFEPSDNSDAEFEPADNPEEELLPIDEEYELPDYPDADFPPPIDTDTEFEPSEPEYPDEEFDPSSPDFPNSESDESLEAGDEPEYSDSEFESGEDLDAECESPDNSDAEFETADNPDAEFLPLDDSDAELESPDYPDAESEVPDNPDAEFLPLDDSDVEFESPDFSDAESEAPDNSDEPLSEFDADAESDIMSHPDNTEFEETSEQKPDVCDECAKKKRKKRRRKKHRGHRGHRGQRHKRQADKIEFKIEKNFTDAYEPVKKVFELNSSRIFDEFYQRSKRERRDTEPFLPFLAPLDVVEPLAPLKPQTPQIPKKHKNVLNIFVDNSSNSTTKMFIDDLQIPIRRKRSTDDVTSRPVTVLNETQTTHMDTTTMDTISDTTIPVIDDFSSKPIEVDESNLKVIALDKSKSEEIHTFEPQKDMKDKLYYSDLPANEPPMYKSFPSWVRGYFPPVPFVVQPTDDPVLEKLFRKSKAMEEHYYKKSDEHSSVPEVYNRFRNSDKIEHEPRFFTHPQVSQSDEPREMKLFLTHILGKDDPTNPYINQNFENSLKLFEYLDEFLKSDKFKINLDTPQHSGANKYFNELTSVLLNALDVGEKIVDPKEAEKLVESIKKFIEFIIDSGKEINEIISASHLEKIIKKCLKYHECYNLDSNVVKNIIINQFNQSISLFINLYTKISILPNCLNENQNCSQIKIRKLKKLLLYASTILNNIFLNTELYLTSLNCKNKCSKLFKLELSDIVNKFQLNIIKSHKKFKV